MDGAGVRLTRLFGFGDTRPFDPFLLLDAFGSDDPDEYSAGFPWHPHRGIETVTYMLEGTVRHGDSLGSGGVIGPGDLQWMTAGSGIIHEEMPQPSPRGVHGLQLWVNLPASEKMTDPAYRGVEAAAVPRVPCEGGEVLVLAGRFGATEGALRGIARDPLYLDVHLDGRGRLELEIPSGHTVFAYLYRGGLARAGLESRGDSGPVTVGECLLFGSGDSIRAEAGESGARFVLASALPLREPVAWRGPIVMNTMEELDLAFREYREGSFIKRR